MQDRLTSRLSAFDRITAGPGLVDKEVSAGVQILNPEGAARTQVRTDVDPRLAVRASASGEGNQAINHAIIIAPAVQMDKGTEETVRGPEGSCLHAGSNGVMDAGVAPTPSGGPMAVVGSVQPMVDVDIPDAAMGRTVGHPTGELALSTPDPTSGALEAAPQGGAQAEATIGQPGGHTPGEQWFAAPDRLKTASAAELSGSAIDAGQDGAGPQRRMEGGDGPMIGADPHPDGGQFGFWPGGAHAWGGG